MNNDLTSKEWGEQFTPPISNWRTNFYYNQNRLPGAYMRGGMLWIPKGTPDPRRPVGAAGHEKNYKRAQRAARREANAGGAEA